MSAAQEGCIRFHYVKSPSFRTVHVDGMIGGPTPNGNVHAAFFSERPAIPTSTKFEVTADGTLGSEVEGGREGREGYVRELDVDCVFTVETAKRFRDWLDESIRFLEARRGGE